MRTWLKKFERLMCAASFAEEGDWDTARVILDSDEKKFQEARKIRNKTIAARPRVRA